MLEWRRFHHEDKREDILENRECELIDTQCAKQRILPDLFDKEFFPCNDSGLGPAEQFVTAERNDIDSTRMLSAASGSSNPGSTYRRSSRCPGLRMSEFAAFGQVSTNSSSDGLSVKPMIRKLLGWTRSSSRVCSLMAFS